MQWLYPVEKGYDPIEKSYAEDYTRKAWKQDYHSGKVKAVVDTVESKAGKLADKRVLDLGAGPGQFTMGLAQRGAQVTWHDPSREYQRLARELLHDVTIEFSIGYLEQASKFYNSPFDIVFCRVCWFYFVSDKRAVDLIVSLLKPGGVARVEVNSEDWRKEERRSDNVWRKISRALYHGTAIKLHYFAPPAKHIPRLFASDARCQVDTEYLPDGMEVIWVKRK